MTDQNKTTCPNCGSAIPNDAPDGLCPACVLESAATIPNPTSTGTTTSGRNSAPPSVGDIAPHFPDLEILELLGAGGMGAVYKARQPQLDRTVAVKILSRELAEDPTFVERFNREARVLARLSHPNIVAVFDFGTAGPYCYLLMEYVDGVNLRQAMRTGGFTPSEALALVQEICAALKFAHDEGILHRDIKPENVLIDSKGEVKMADFGIAKLIGEGEPESITLTMQGSILGSPHYMAPEQIETPGDVDQRADIYSLGVVLYEMLTGELPIGRFALPSEKAPLDARIDEIVMRTLEKEREARFQSAEEVRTEVEAVPLGPAPRPAPAPGQIQTDRSSARFSLIAAILTGLSLLLAGVTLYLANTLRDPDVRTIGIVLGLILAGGSALVGFILGARALSEIRKSGGRKDGLGSAVFAVVVWPVLLAGVVSSAFLSLPIPGSAGGIGMWVVMLFLGVPQILIAAVLVRGLRRWAGGVPFGDDGARIHPGLGRTMLGVVGLILLGPVMIVVATWVLPPGEHHDRFAEIEREMTMAMEANERDLAVLSNVNWREGQPEVILPIELDPGLRATFHLIQREEGVDAETTKIGELTAKTGPGVPRSTSVIKVGTVEDNGPVLAQIHELATVFDSDTGYESYSSGSDFRNWEFEESLSSSPELTQPGRWEFRLATRRDEARNEAGTLTLEIVVTSMNV